MSKKFLKCNKLSPINILLITIHCMIIITAFFFLPGCDEPMEGLGGAEPASLKSGSKDYDTLVRIYSKKNHLPESLVEAVIEAESAWDSNAVSSQGAMGLMQLMPGTADMLGVKDPFDPEDNIAGGTKYLGMMVDEFGDYELAVAAYNAGPGAVEEYNGIPPYSETVNYVAYVMLLYHSYEGKKDRISKI